MKTPEFGKQEIEELKIPYRKLRDSIFNEIESRLEKRDKTKNYLRTDNEIFQPFIEAYVLGILVTPFDSLCKEIGTLVHEQVIKEYEANHGVKLNKEQFYFAMAMLSIRMNDEVNATIYWELANKEHEHTTGNTVDGDFLVDELKTKFKTIHNNIRDAYERNTFVQTFRSKYPFIMSFDDLIKDLSGINKLHLLSSAVKNRKLQLWLRNHPESNLIRIYSQEIINSLSILGESVLKEIPSVTAHTLGSLLKSNLQSINPSVYSFTNGTNLNLFTKYPTNSIPTFNTHFPNLISDIETHTMSEEEFKAHILYGAYMIRNQVLHQFDDSICYYGNQALFEKTIGLLLTNISVIKSL